MIETDHIYKEIIKKAVNGCTTNNAIDYVQFMVTDGKMWLELDHSGLGSEYMSNQKARINIFNKLEELLLSSGGSNQANCEQCKKQYYQRTSKSRFCSSKCRAKNHRNKKNL